MQMNFPEIRKNKPTRPLKSFWRKSFLRGEHAALLPALAGARELPAQISAPDFPSFELDEITISDLQAGMFSANSRHGLSPRNICRELKQLISKVLPSTA